MSVEALVLAAGGSRRLGRPKQIEPWGEKTLLGFVLDEVRKYRLREVWLVLGHAAEEVMAAVDLNGISVIENPEWPEGIASSLRAGLDAMTRLSRADSVLVITGDQAEMSDSVVAELISSHRRAGRPVTVPKYRYTTGTPAIIDRSLWPRMMSLEGDEGAKRLWAAHPEWVNEVRFAQDPPRDVDTETDVDELKPRGSGQT